MVSPELIRRYPFFSGLNMEQINFLAKVADEKILEEGEYFVIGDNRGNILDYRFLDYGHIKIEWIKGKVELRYLHLDRYYTICSGKINFTE